MSHQEKRKRPPPKERVPLPDASSRSAGSAHRRIPPSYSGPKITDPHLLECLGKGGKRVRGGSRAAAIYRGLTMEGWTLYYCLSNKRFYIWGPEPRMQYFESLSSAYAAYNAIVSKIRRDMKNNGNNNSDGGNGASGKKNGTHNDTVAGGDEEEEDDRSKRQKTL